jgi:NTE family protein
VLDRADITVAVDVTGMPRRRPGDRLPRTLDAVTGSTQILFHSLTRAKLKAAAPHILIRPGVGAFGAMDYFKVKAILAAAQPAKEDLKRKLSQVLAKTG